MSWNQELQARLGSVQANAGHSVLALEHRAQILVEGADAESFLQGQLSCDMRTLSAGSLQWGSMNSAKGRVLAVLWIRREAAGFSLETDAGIADDVCRRLKMYVLRSKVEIQRLADTEWLAAGVYGPKARTEIPEDWAESQTGPLRCTRLPAADGESRLQYSGPPDAVLAHCATLSASVGDAETWHRHDIACGIPRVMPDTQDLFVAQMLDLGHYGALAFDKGCFTGQEVIARMHYRGGVKRHLYLAHSDGPPPPPAAVIRIAENAEEHAGSEAGQVLEATGDGQGGALICAVLRGEYAASPELCVETPEQQRLGTVSRYPGREAPASS